MPQRTPPWSSLQKVIEAVDIVITNAFDKNYKSLRKRQKIVHCPRRIVKLVSIFDTRYIAKLAVSWPYKMAKLCA